MKNHVQLPPTDPLGGAGLQAPEREIRCKSFGKEESHGKNDH